MARHATIELGGTAWRHRAAAPRLGGAAPVLTAAVLRFALPRAVEAAVLVHDSGGRIVRTLLSGELTAGEHACGWDGRDELQTPSPPGQYVLRLEVAGRLVTSRRVSID